VEIEATKTFGDTNITTVTLVDALVYLLAQHLVY
jgi:hypothetical protein